MTPAMTLRAQARGGGETCSDEARTFPCAFFLLLIFVLGVRHNTTLVFIRRVVSALVLVTSPPQVVPRTRCWHVLRLTPRLQQIITSLASKLSNFSVAVICYSYMQNYIYIYIVASLR